MNNNEPLVTIAITTYNRCKLLEKALDSIVNQTYKNLDILIADNHSEDSTEQLCLKYAANDSRIRYYRHDRNIGMEENGKFAVKNARGKYFMGLCDDDWVSENFIEEAVRYLESTPNSVGAGSTVYLYDENYNLLEKCTSKTIESNNLLKRLKDLAANMMKLRAVLLCSNLHVYNQIIENAQSRFCEDQIIAMKACSLGKVIILDNAIYHKIHNGCTKDLETLVKTYNLEGFTPENYPYKLAQCHKDAIMNDKFYTERLNEKQRKKLANNIYKAIIRTNTPRCQSDELRGYMWRHPLFLFDKRFYSKLKSYLGIVEIKNEDV